VRSPAAGGPPPVCAGTRDNSSDAASRVNPAEHRIPQSPEHERAQDLFLLTGTPGLCFADSRLVFWTLPVASGIRAPRRTELALRWVRGAAAEPRVARTPLGQDDVGTARRTSRIDAPAHAGSLSRRAPRRRWTGDENG
jgi:hypothetical protein